MKQAELDYQELPGGMVKIVGWRNVKSREDLARELSPAQYAEYMGKDKGPMFVQLVAKDRLFVHPGPGGFSVILSVGGILPKADFEQAVGVMKAAGKRLSAIINTPPKVKTVTI